MLLKLISVTATLTMKLLVVLFVTFLVICASQKYTTKYDNIDLNQILKSDRLLGNYIKCLLDKGKCSPDGLELKAHIQDALVTNCQKCSERQKTGSRTVARYLIQHKRGWWNELQAKYDPSGIYIKANKAELIAQGIQL